MRDIFEGYTWGSHKTYGPKSNPCSLKKSGLALLHASEAFAFAFGPAPSHHRISIIVAIIVAIIVVIIVVIIVHTSHQYHRRHHRRQQHQQLPQCLPPPSTRLAVIKPVGDGLVTRGVVDVAVPVLPEVLDLFVSIFLRFVL